MAGRGSSLPLYALPLVGRAGLGNMLFPWARAEIFAREHGARMLAPNWAAFRLGPYLRREPERRNYLRSFRAPHHLRGVSRLIIPAFGNTVDENDFRDGRPVAPSSGRPVVVLFQGMGELFRPLLTAQDFIRAQLWAMTQGELRATGAAYGDRFIAMHIRRGDLTRQGFTPEELLAVQQYTPISWFSSMARMIRQCPELADLPIVVFTDGSDDEVSEVLGHKNVQLHRRLGAIADMWTLAHATLLFASGYSTFGMWASFLGRMPTVYAPGKLSQPVQAGAAEAMEIELAAEAEWPDHLRARLAGSRSLARVVG